jgi:predicted amidohydrolase
VQFPLQPLTSAREYAEACYRWTRRAVEAGAQLVVFPEFVGTIPLLGLFPGVGALRLDEPGESGSKDENLVSGLARAAARIAFPPYYFVFQSLARGFEVHIAAGSVLVGAEDGTVQNVAFLFDPHGNEVGRQPKCHLYGLEFALQLARGTSIQAFDTAVGKLACPVCMDHTYFETARIAYLHGAEILIDSSADVIAEYNWWYQLRGVWSRVQESPAYGIQAMMVGDALGLPFRGRSAVFGPVGLVARDGVLACAEACDQGEVVVADLDLEALRAYRSAWEAKPRSEWCARQLGALWGRIAG